MSSMRRRYHDYTCWGYVNCSCGSRPKKSHEAKQKISRAYRRKDKQEMNDERKGTGSVRLLG